MEEQRPHIAVLTSGGDAPGMNAAVRAVVRTAIAAGAEAFGIEHGYEGLLDECFRPLALGDVGGILDRGGTFLGTARSERFRTPEGVAEGCRILKDRGITSLVVIGGEGSFRGARALADCGVVVAGIPATIDNDIAGTDTSIGFDTAINTVCDAVGKIRDTASSHERTFVIEVMGRHSGNLALYAGIASGADCILVPEVPWRLEDICKTVEQGVKRGKKHSIVVLAEGAGDALELGDHLAGLCGQNVRTTILGHIQRGGSPSGFDRILASRMGARAVHSLLAGEVACAVGLRCAEAVTYPLEEAYQSTHVFNRELYDLSGVLAT